MDAKLGNIAKADVPATGFRRMFDDLRDAPRGFGLRMSSPGTKVFIQRHTIDRRRKHKTIGEWPAWGLEQARIEACRLFQQIGSGGDPLEKKLLLSITAEKDPDQVEVGNMVQLGARV